MSVSIEETRRIGEQLSVNWEVVPVKTFQKALISELEHTDVTHGDLKATGMIALAHLREDPHYYSRLAVMEAKAKKYWSTHKKPSPTLGGGMLNQNSVIILVLLIVVIAYFAWKYWKKNHQSKFMPGDTRSRNILRRSSSGRFPSGGLADYYFQYDPAYSAPFETDYCWHAPAACAGFALE